MDNKLTLKLDSQVIEQAKTYARRRNTSLSKLVESYLELLTSQANPSGDDITPLVKSLSDGSDLDKKIDYRKDYKKHILKKYTK
ncbi:MAG: hypothetical protein K1X68_04840 [Saprospiraceae bacterium]|nr:hypothetical protein [Saprospiraceae bacterium]HMW40158.1 DUF6364 family protein [Saprospiraceae bacterium]HMX88964.1 DUF6364 family protein [Saprospiraceae bacterium]HMZ40171.1 DUF6364 family protein [Saprospiraceae bacterium]HNB30573.1 DUF6364 family protein [Saprospiraceae bacterium]